MITDKKRREIAQKLLALDMSDIEVDGCIIDSPKYVGLLLMRILDATCDYRDGLRYFPGFFSAQAVVELLAELIDRPACRIVHDENGDCDVCTSCSTSFELAEFDYADANVFEGYSYCPKCGAVVVDED